MRLWVWVIRLIWQGAVNLVATLVFMLALTVLFWPSAQAQTVYRCEVSKKVVYQDFACRGPGKPADITWGRASPAAQMAAQDRTDRVLSLPIHPIQYPGPVCIGGCPPPPPVRGYLLPPPRIVVFSVESPLHRPVMGLY